MYSECVFSLGIQRTRRMRRITLSTVSCLALPYFPTLSHKRHNFQKKVIEHKMCVLIPYRNFETLLILRKIQRDIITYVNMSPCKVVSLLPDFDQTLIFSKTFSKNNPMPNFMKIRLVGADLFHANGHAGMAQLTIAFHRFSNTSKTHPCDLLNPSHHNSYFANLLLYHSTLCIWPTLYFCASYETY